MKSILTHENELRNTEALETERPPSHTDPAKARPNPSGRARDRKWQGHAEEGRVQGRAFGPKGDFRSPKSHPTITPETIVVLVGTQEAPRRPRVEQGRRGSRVPSAPCSARPPRVRLPSSPRGAHGPAGQGRARPSGRPSSNGTSHATSFRKLSSCRVKGRVLIVLRT